MIENRSCLASNRYGNTSLTQDFTLTTPPSTRIVTAIVPARNEEKVIAGCVESLEQQPEIAEILVVDDQSTDRTADIVRGLTAEIPRLRLLQTGELPSGWVGKNNAVWMAAQEAKARGCYSPTRMPNWHLALWSAHWKLRKRPKRRWFRSRRNR